MTNVSLKTRTVCIGYCLGHQIQFNGSEYRVRFEGMIIKSKVLSRIKDFLYKELITSPWPDFKVK